MQPRKVVEVPMVVVVVVAVAMGVTIALGVAVVEAVVAIGAVAIGVAIKIQIVSRVSSKMLQDRSKANARVHNCGQFGTPIKTSTLKCWWRVRAGEGVGEGWERAGRRM